MKTTLNTQQETTIIRISKELCNKLISLKVHHRESYNDLLIRLLKIKELK